VASVAGNTEAPQQPLNSAPLGYFPAALLTIALTGSSARVRLALRRQRPVGSGAIAELSIMVRIVSRSGFPSGPRRAASAISASCLGVSGRRPGHGDSLPTALTTRSRVATPSRAGRG
jgi:hypothetical protein